MATPVTYPGVYAVAALADAALNGRNRVITEPAVITELIDAGYAVAVPGLDRVAAVTEEGLQFTYANIVTIDRPETFR